MMVNLFYNFLQHTYYVILLYAIIYTLTHLLKHVTQQKVYIYYKYKIKNYTYTKKRMTIQN